jgi:hypothetical protein
MTAQNAMEGLGGFRGTFERLEGKLAGDDFLEGDVRQGHARSRFNHRPVPETELANALGNNVDQELLVGDYLSGFLEKLSRHMAQGSDGAVRFRRELKDGRRTRGERGGCKLRGGEHKKEALTLPRSPALSTDFVGSADVDLSIPKATTNRLLAPPTQKLPNEYLLRS